MHSSQLLQYVIRQKKQKSNASNQFKENYNEAIIYEAVDVEKQNSDSLLFQGLYVRRSKVFSFVKQNASDTRCQVDLSSVALQ